MIVTTRTLRQRYYLINIMYPAKNITKNGVGE
jgi:hypothetical protein